MCGLTLADHVGQLVADNGVINKTFTKSLALVSILQLGRKRSRHMS